MENKKGFTIVELLVALGLTCIIISLSITFFSKNLKSYKYISDNAELQFQAQYILNFMANKIAESKHIELINEYTVSHIKKVSEQKITRISFRYGTSLSQCYNFELINNKIRYGNSSTLIKPADELGCYVKEINVTPINGKSFEYTESIIIKLILEKNKQKYEMEQIVFMRNFDK